MKRTASAFGVLVVLLISLTACSGDPRGPLANVQLHPHGDLGHWFHDEYANGIEREYKVEGTLCAISDGVAIESSGNRGLDATSSVSAVDLRSEATLWTIRDAFCGEQPVVGGAVTVGLLQDTDPPPDWNTSTWILVEAMNGERLQEIDLTGSDLRQVAQVDDVRVLSRYESELFGLTPEGIRWNMTIPGVNRFTPLSDGHIGVKDGFDGGSFSVLDGRTGDVTVPSTDFQDFLHIWASDGFISVDQSHDAESVFYDLNGEEVHKAKDHTPRAFAPSQWSTQVTFPLEEHRTANQVIAVDAQGKPALFTDERGEALLTRTDDITGLVRMTSEVRATSRDGSLFFTDSFTLDHPQIFDETGETVVELPDAVDVKSVGGCLTVLRGGVGTVVLIPADSR